MCKTLISIVYEDIEIEETTVITNSNGVKFKSSGKISVNSETSWQKVSGATYQNDIPKNINIKDDVLAKYSLNQSETKPPARFT